MGHHLFRFGKHKQRNYMYADFGRRGRGCPDDDYGRDDDVRPALRIPASVVLGGLVLWSAIALGTWWLVDPMLAWISGAAGPLIDAGVGIARWFGLGREALVLRDSANVQGLVGWAVGPVHVLAKAVVLLVWIGGLTLLIAAPSILNRRRRGWQ